MGFLYWICVWILVQHRSRTWNGRRDSGQHQLVGNHYGEDQIRWVRKVKEDQRQKFVADSALIQAEKEEGAENNSKEVQRNRSTERALVCMSQERIICAVKWSRDWIWPLRTTGDWLPVHWKMRNGKSVAGGGGGAKETCLRNQAE